MKLDRKLFFGDSANMAASLKVGMLDLRKIVDACLKAQVLHQVFLGN